MKLHKKFTSFAVFALVLTILFSNLTVFATDFSNDVATDSKSIYMVYMGENGDIPVVNINSEEINYPASLTKIMTAIVLLENYNFADLESTVVTVPSEAFEDFYVDGVYQNPSTAGFLRGENVDLRDLLYGMMLQSACEAANVIAYHVGGNDISNFVNMMNETAQKIGAVNTHFTNPHGLFDENQYTTAYDMYLISKYAYSLDGFMEVASTESFYLRPTNKHSEKRLVVHTNYMMSPYRGGDRYYYEYVNGIKTGTLDECGRNLVTTATKDGYTYMIVSLGGPQKDADGNNYFSNFLDHKNLYKWAFADLEISKIVNAGSDIMEFPVRNSAGKDYVIASAKDDYITLLPVGIEKERISFELPSADTINAPITKGETLGEMKVYVDGDYLTSVDLIAANDVKLSIFKYIFYVLWLILSSKVFITILFILVVLIVIYIFIFYKQNKDKLDKKAKRKQMR